MAFANPAPRLIVNADDFGRSHAINQAVAQAHREGILTSASLMTGGAAFDEAVEIARQNPTLAIGLHLTLVAGNCTAPHERVAQIAEPRGQLHHNPVRAGMRFFFRGRSLRPDLENEIDAQFEKFHSTGLALDHVNGHLNFHLHPSILSLLLKRATNWKIPAIRLTRDPFFLNAQLSSGNWAYRISHGIIFTLLSWWAKPRLRALGLRYADPVFGLLQNGRVTEEYLCRLLPRIRTGTAELYSHPSTDDSRPELEALVSPKVKSVLQQGKIQLIRYGDL